MNLERPKGDGDGVYVGSDEHVAVFVTRDGMPAVYDRVAAKETAARRVLDYR